ncbi:MAG: GNAT family N-acetyltransferase [Candidatus Hydrogenedentes bacterium]|nr:GNAT family N-acetyltransferase [Candidatus Hydrogenedentota bacterium]
MRIREAAREDREAIERLVNAGARDVRKRIGPHPPPVKSEDLSVRGCRGLVAVAAGRIVGSVTYRVRGGRLHLFNLVVDAKHRGNGVARALVLELEDVARRDRAKQITLQTVAELGVEPMFEKLGYRVKSAKREFLFSSDQKRALTTVYMVKRLGKSPGPVLGD